MPPQEPPRALRDLFKGQTLYKQTPDQPPKRPLCYDLREFVSNSCHPGPRRAWDVGSELRVLPPLPRIPLLPLLPRLPPRVPKSLFSSNSITLQRPPPPWTISSCAQAADLVRVAALPCGRQHRPNHFRQKNTYVLEHYFPNFSPAAAQTLVFSMNSALPDD